jgi:hypothetical protein
MPGCELDNLFSTSADEQTARCSTSLLEADSPGHGARGRGENRALLFHAA